MAGACRKCRKCRGAEGGFAPAAGPRIGLDRDVADVANDAAPMSYSLALAREVASFAMTQCRKCRKCRNIFAERARHVLLVVAVAGRRLQADHSTSENEHPSANPRATAMRAKGANGLGVTSDLNHARTLLVVRWSLMT